MVEAAEAGIGTTLTELLAMLKVMGTLKDIEDIKRYGPTVCPDSTCIQPDLDFQLTQISDCVVVSSEVSPAGVINLIHHCWGVVFGLLRKGLMCRGCITRGSIYHTENQFIGTGYQEAQFKEKRVTIFARDASEKGTPFVEVDPAVRDYVMNDCDACVKEMFPRFVKEDGELIALFPFKRLVHSLGGTSKLEDEKRSNHQWRLIINKLKEGIMASVDQSNGDAKRKGEYYIAALNTQLAECDRIDEEIDWLNSPFPAHRIKDIIK